MIDVGSESLAILGIDSVFSACRHFSRRDNKYINLRSLIKALTYFLRVELKSLISFYSIFARL